LKYNLKNRPKEIESIRYDWWFEGFKAELREKYLHQKQIYKIPTVSIKEILGE